MFGNAQAELAAAEEPHAVGFAGRVREGFSAGRAQRDGRAGLRRDGAGARAGGGDAAGDGARERRGGAQGSKGVGGVGGYLNAAVVMQGLGGQVAGGVGQEEEGEGGGGGARTGFGVDDMDDDGAELPAIGTLRPKALPMLGEVTASCVFATIDAPLMPPSQSLPAVIKQGVAQGMQAFVSSEGLPERRLWQRGIWTSL